MTGSADAGRARRLGLCLLAGAITSGLFGWLAGAALVLANPVAGFGQRFTLMTLVAFIYLVLATLPFSLGLAVWAELVPRARRFPILLASGLLLVGCLSGARHAVAALGTNADPWASLTSAGLTIGAALAVAFVIVALGRWRVFEGSSGRLAAAVVLVASLAAALVAAVPVRDPFVPKTAELAPLPLAVDVQEIEAVEPRRRLALIGFDGLDPRVFDRLIEVGGVPQLAALRARGLYSPIETLPPGFSPPIWTTIATGVHPFRHEVFDFVARRFDPLALDLSAVNRYPHGFALTRLFSWLYRSPLVSERFVRPGDRRAPAIWTLASEAGIDTCVVDWMGTWPGESVSGVMVSDRAYFARNLGSVGVTVGDISTRRIPTQDPSVADAASPEARPSDAGICTPEPACLDFLPDVLPSQRADPADSHPFHRGEDLFYTEAALRILRSRPCDFFVFYSHLPDFVNHEISPDDLEAVLSGRFESKGAAAFVHVYRHVDQTLGRLLAALGDDVDVLLVSDHGVTIAGEGEGRFVTHGAPAPPGVLMFARADRVRPDWNGTPNVYDVAPTLLSLLGLPLTSAMPGRVLPVGEGLAAVGVLDEHAIAPSTPAQGAGPADPLAEDELRARLRALGYLEDP